MESECVIDVNELVRDLRAAVQYASRAGLLKDTPSMDLIKSAENTISKDERPNVPVLLKALNSIARTISPLTIADLHNKRDPFTVENQDKAKTFQLLLSVLAIIMITLIGYSTLAMQSEEAAIVAVSKIQDLHAELKLDSLRRLAQTYKITAVDNVNSIKYHEDLQIGLDELRRMNAQIYDTLTEASDSYNKGFLPVRQLLTFLHNDPAAQGGYDPSVLATTSSSPSSTTQVDAEKAQGNNSKNTVSEAKGVGNTIPIDSQTDPQQSTGDGQKYCAADADGNVQVPTRYKAFPPWLQQVFTEQLNDECFLFEIVSPDGGAVRPNQVLNQLGFTTGMKMDIAIRARWFLPFCYGLFGSIIFLMRNVASIRTPAMTWCPMIMRLFLGGMAGIIIGWFSSTQNAGVESTGALSIPFAAAFLVGYGIDVLFNLLDRFNQALGEIRNKT
jgi:hypothetical protein